MTMQLDAARVRVIRAPTRLASSEITAPMDRFFVHRGRRASWYGGMESVLVEIGIDGWDEAAHVGIAVTQGGAAVATLLEQHLLPLALGAKITRIRDIELLHEKLRLATLPYGSGGIAAMARSAIDIAVWDLFGKVRSTPVFRLLDGDPAPLPVYATGNDIEHHRALGFTTSKVGLQYGPWHHDGVRRACEQIERARECAGDRHGLMVDGWMGLDQTFVDGIAPTLRGASVEWLEEPLPPDDIRGLRGVARVLGDVKLATGEHATTRADLLTVAASGARVLQPDLAWCGGITEVRALAACLPVDVELAPHLSGTAWGVHVAASLPQVRRVEWYVESIPGESIGAARTPVVGGPVPTGGVIAPSEAPGLGLAVDAEFVDQWADEKHVINAR